MLFVMVMFSKSAPWVCNQKMRFKLGRHCMAHVHVYSGAVNFTPSVGAQEQLLYASFTWCMYDLYTGKRASIVSVCYIIIMAILLLWTHRKPCSHTSELYSHEPFKCY